MPWTAPKGKDPRYGAAHVAYRKLLVAQLRAVGYLICTAPVCVMPSRAIIDADGRHPAGLHAGHNSAGTAYAGPQHRACNIRDGSVRGRARQDKQRWRL